MRGRAFLRIATGVLLFFLSPGLTAAVTSYVDGSVSEPGDGKSWETAFQKIEEGMDTATDGDTVIVAGGTYLEKIRFDGKSVHLVSRDGPARTIIDASRSGTVVTFDCGEGSGATFEGFSVTGGGGSNGGSGIYCEGSSPTILNCCIFRNISAYPDPGGGICCREANPTISHCVIYSNWSHEWGGGIWCYKSSPRFEGCAIVQNSAFYGGGGIACDNECFPVIVNCTIFGNLSPWSGGGIDSGWKSSTLVINTIIWGNQQGDIQVSNGSIELRSCVYDGSVWSLDGEFIDGGGNISADPMFAKPLMPIPHLSAASPCVDAGLEQDMQPRDIDGEPRVIGGRVDIGADEYLDSDTDGLPDWWELWYFFDPVAPSPEDDLDKDNFSNSDEYFRGTNPIASSPTTFYVSAASGNDDWNGMSESRVGWDIGPKATIQAAIDAASNGDEVIVAAGTYEENMTFAGKNLHVRSASGREVTVIQPLGGGAVVTFGMGEGRDAILEGLGITEGHAYSGGGFDCFRSSPTVRDCAVYENWGGTEGGGFYCLESSPLIERCEIYNNGTEERGAAIHCDKCNPIILSCEIYGNEIGCCGPAGIYLRESGGLVADCKLYGNTSPGVGAIRCDDSWTTFERCAIYENSAGSCSGFLLQSSPVTITNCLVYDNISSNESAVWCGASSPTIVNCTIFGNTSLQGTGGCGPAGIYLRESGGLVADCKLYGNTSSGVGAIRCDDSWTTFERCAIYENSAGSCSGFLLQSSPVTITDCVVYDNTSSNEPAVWCGASSPTIVNCTIFGNTSLQGTGGVVLSEFSTALFVNSIVWGNRTRDLTCGSEDKDWKSPAVLSHCDIGEVYGSYVDGGGNISADPLLGREFLPVPHLLAGSPCIDAGLNQDWMWGSVDLAGNPRIANRIVDIGAYEFLRAPWVTITQEQDVVTLRWGEFADGRYTVQWRDDLVQGMWQNAPGTWPLSDLMWLDIIGGEVLQRFYRLECAGVYSDPVGFVKVFPVEEGFTMVSVPFIAADSRLNGDRGCIGDMIAEALTGGPSAEDADIIWKWDGTTQSYAKAYLVAGKGQPYDGRWWDDDTGGFSTMRLNVGECCWILRRPRRR